MRYFITGATGFIGGEIARQLVAAGHEVTALVRAPNRARDLAALGVTLAEGDITDRQSLRSPMAGVDGLFHVAAWYELGVRDAARMEQINVEGTRNVLTVMRELSIPKGVYTSTLAVFSDTGGEVVDESYYHDGRREGWLSQYDRTKWLAHYEVALPMMEAGLPLVIVMPGVVYGPGDQSATGQTLRQYLRRRLLAIPRVSAYSWAHVEDAARGHILAMDKGRPGESYIIAGPVHTTAEALESAERVTGVPAPRLRLPPGIVRGMARLMDIAGRFLPLPATYSGEGLRSVNATYTGSNARARRELGYVPRPLEEGLRQTLEYEVEQLRQG